MRHRSPLRDIVEYALARAVVFSLEWMPLPLARGLARLYAGALDHAVPRLRRVALRNLAMAVPDLDSGEHARIVDGIFASVGRLLLTFARFPRMDRNTVGQWIRYEGYEHFEAALARGKGVLFATAHLGNWELSAFAHALLTAPMSVVVRPLDNRLIDRMVARRRTLSGNQLIEKKEFARAILTALRDNQAVGVLIDQNAAPEHGAFVDFFGIPACAATGFAKLAARSGAAVIPGFALWSGRERRYILHFFPAVPMTGAIEADTAALHKVLEDVIRKHPDQWLWIHRRWKTRPPGAPSLY